MGDAGASFVCLNLSVKDLPASFPHPEFAPGAKYLGDQQCSFLLWAPKVHRAEVRVLFPRARTLPLRAERDGYHCGIFEGIEAGSRYLYRLEGERERPDPASRFQPEGVHGPSEIVDPVFDWDERGWCGLPLRDYIIYELHVGTFTLEGTFEAIIPRLAELKGLGITAVELMPVGQFPGTRNWGYDGVYPYAPQNSYGGPAQLKRLVNAAHQHGLAVVLDVVYNHLGPEGNCLNDFGPYFTQRHRTPWGASLNFDGAESEPVRRFFLENALYWQTEFHFDALRLDAVHMIKDASARPFLQDLAQLTHRRGEELNHPFYLIAESDLNDARIITPEVQGGCGLDAQWSDDFHHCLHVLLTGERDGYYQDFGETKLLAKVWREGYAYTGQYSRFRRRHHGNSPRLNSARQFVVCSQNHDQVGNRLHGERLSQLADLEALKVAAGAVLLSPFIPLLFMGEEYGETAPFQYMISHGDPELVQAVRQGRRQEFSGFDWQGEVPDPQSEATFQECVLKPELCRDQDEHRALHDYYRRLLRLRKEVPAIAGADKDTLEVQALEGERVLSVIYTHASVPACLLLCFAAHRAQAAMDLPAGSWQRLLDSSSPHWHGPGGGAPDRLSANGLVLLNLPGKSVTLYQRMPKG